MQQNVDCQLSLQALISLLNLNDCGQVNYVIIITQPFLLRRIYAKGIKISVEITWLALPERMSFSDLHEKYIVLVILCRNNK